MRGFIIISIIVEPLAHGDVYHILPSYFSESLPWKHQQGQQPVHIATDDRKDAHHTRVAAS